MNIDATATITAGVITTVGVCLSAWLTHRSLRDARISEVDAVATRFREPVLQAAFNLQARLYNIVALNFLERFMTAANTDEDREYALEHTLYLIGQYFCWVEVLRRESQFLDPRDQERNRALADHLEQVRDRFAGSEADAGLLRIFRGEQRAMAEAMMTVIDVPVAGAPRWECIGYGTFIRKRSDPEIERWFRQPRLDLANLCTAPKSALARLVKAQHALMDLVDLLDPEGHRVSQNMRNRLT